MRRVTTSLLLLALVLGPLPALARDVIVRITNLTNAIYFTPLLVAVHRPGTDLFEVGIPASPQLQMVAEGGQTEALAAVVEAAGGRVVDNPAGGLLAPGQTAVARLQVNGQHRRISVVAMLLPTNDGFVGLDAQPLPLLPSRRTYYVNGYDAGTEANDELITGGGMPGEPGIPGDPSELGGINGTGVAGPDHSPAVHAHRGIVGDLDPVGGASDLDRGQHSWQGPVARIVVVTRPLKH